MLFRPADWYWKIAGNDAQVYASKRNIYVALDDPDFVAWNAGNLIGAPMASEAEIWPYVSGPPRMLPEWMFDGTTFAQPAPAEYTKVQLHAYQILVRYNKEQGGMTLSSGMPIKTDDRSQAKINGLRHIAEVKGSGFTTQFHADDDNFYNMIASDIISMSDQLQVHVDNCFSISSNVARDIDAGTITSLAQIDSAFEAVATRVPDWAK
jgi:hypothetical protein